jgi:hypothetical protein
MSIAEFAVFFQFNSLAVLLFILGGCVIALLALSAGHSNTYSHAYNTSILVHRNPRILYHTAGKVSMLPDLDTEIKQGVHPCC